MEDVFRDAPLQIIAIKDDGFFEITVDGINFLSALKNKKLSILSVTGPYRSGKSFLSNLIMNKMAGFKTGGTTNACTKGLWAWGKPIELENGSSLIIIDSEGLGSVDKDRELNIDLKIFTLCVLMSTTIMYNTKHAISEDKIEELATVANLSKRVNILKKSEVEIDASNTESSTIQLNNSITSSNGSFSDYFPTLVWVLRDFTLDTKELTPNQYLEKSLEIAENTVKDGIDDKIMNRNIIKQNFRNRECYTLVIPATDEQVLRNLENEPRESLRPEFLKQVDTMISNIKATIQAKKINNFYLDGEALFGLIQNYIDSLNSNENPVIFNALENVLLSKAKNISEKHFEDFKRKVAEKITKKLPLELNEIYKDFFELQDEVIPKFCESINDTLTVNQCSDYLLKLTNRMRFELENILENNKLILDEWYDMEFDELTKSYPYKELNKIDDINNYFINFSLEWNKGMTKFVEIPNEFSKNVISIIIKILNDYVFDRMRKTGLQISELYSNSQRDNANTVENLKTQIKKLEDQFNQEKRLNEERMKEKSELWAAKIDLDNKVDKLNRDLKSKEKENAEIEKIAAQKLEKQCTYYENSLKDKDNKITNLERQKEELNRKIYDLNREISNKTLEYSKENTKLAVELESLKGKQDRNKGKTEVYDTKNLNLQSLFRTIQNTFVEFREAVEKLDREKENVFKTKYLELSTKDIENKSRNWIDEIRIFREDQIRAISENYERSMTKTKDDLEECQLNLTRTQFKLDEEIQMKESYKSKYEDAKNDLNEYKEIAATKDSIISTQKEACRLKEDQINELKKQMYDLEINLNQSIVTFKMKEDELDTLLMVVEGILGKRKDKYEHNLIRLSFETKRQIEGLVKEFKIFGK